jgi:DNA (cytosine-5)-methyltransferase 1
MKKFRVIDLFAGVGGLSYGFSINPNFEIVMANEYEKDIAKAYKLNHPTVDVIDCDIEEITADDLKKYIGNDGIDLIIGGPPCQSYSTLGKRQMDDRAHLFEEYCRILSIVKPKVFVYENVQGLLSMQKGKLIEIIKDRFRELGYDIKIKVLNAVDYGVPQYRARVILVGMKGENIFEYPEPTHGEGLLPYLTVEDAFSDLPKLKSGQGSTEYASEPKNEYQKYLRENSKKLTENTAPKNGEHLIRIMEALPDGGSKEDLPLEIRPKSGYGNTYAKMWWKRPAPTVTRNFATPSSSRCVHPRDSRALTTREGARLQSFPDDYKFYGSRTMKNLEIGNAVPPLLSIAIAKKIEDVLKKI